MGSYTNWRWSWNDPSVGVPDSIYKNNFITKLNQFLGFTKSQGISSQLNAKYGLDLSDDEWRTLLAESYGDETYGLLDTKHWDIDYDRFEKNLAELNAASPRPDEYLDPQSYWDDAVSRAQSETQEALDELEGIRQMQVDNFNDELKNLASGYNTARSGILSNQYRQNAQLMDTMTSQLDRQNRNALEAGASAGLRLAGNINTLLSTQNQQSQTSLETANQLAQMMVNQRNAEASVRGRYGDYMNQHFATKQSIKNDEYAKTKDYFNTEFDVAQKANDKALLDWDNKYGSNPLWEYKNKSKFNNTGG